MPPAGPTDPDTDDRKPAQCSPPQQSQPQAPPPPPWPLGDPRIVGHGPASRSRLALIRRLNAHRPPVLSRSPVPVAAALLSSQATPASAAAPDPGPATAAPATTNAATPVSPRVPMGMVLGTGHPYYAGDGMLVPLYVTFEEEADAAPGSSATVVRSCDACVR